MPQSWQAARVLAVALVMVASGVSNARLVAQGSNADEKETEIIRGTVINSITHEPIGRALVFSPDNRFAMMSDAEGHFEFKIPRIKNEAQSGNGPGGMITFRSSFGGAGGTSGPNSLMAKKPGYLNEENAQQAPLSDASEQDVTIQLVPEALLVGRVNLATTDGAENLQVELYRQQIQEGSKQWVSAGMAQTRANGEFRFADLSAGTYKLFTREHMDRDPLTFNRQGQLYGYPPIYYPTSNDFESASTIRVTAGATLNVNLSPERREYYPIKVAVASVPQGSGLQIEVWPQGHPGPGYALGFDQGEQNIVGALPDGNYTIQATAVGLATATGQLHISVMGGGIDGALLSLVPNGSMRVDVKPEFKSEETTSQLASVEEVDGEGRSKPIPKSQMILRGMQVLLFRIDEFSAGIAAMTKPLSGPNDDSLLIENVQPGRYLVQTNAPIGYIASVTLGGVDLLRNPLVVPPGGTSSPIEITLRDDGATVDGTIENWETQGRKINLPAQPPSCVYLVPMTGTLGQPPITWISQDGSFSFRQVPPGTYRAIAFDRQPVELEFKNEEAMKKYEAKSRLIELDAGQREQLQLQLNSIGE